MLYCAVLCRQTQLLWVHVWNSHVMSCWEHRISQHPFPYSVWPYLNYLFRKIPKFHILLKQLIKAARVSKMIFWKTLTQHFNNYCNINCYNSILNKSFLDTNQSSIVRFSNHWWLFISCLSLYYRIKVLIYVTLIQSMFITTGNVQYFV